MITVLGESRANQSTWSCSQIPNSSHCSLLIVPNVLEVGLTFLNALTLKVKVFLMTHVELNIGISFSSKYVFNVGIHLINNDTL